MIFFFSLPAWGHVEERADLPVLVGSYGLVFVMSAVYEHRYERSLFYLFICYERSSPDDSVFHSFAFYHIDALMHFLF